jgi:DNA-binding transcriptional LysR family regulator
MTLNLINKLNPSHLKVFEAVYRHKSMTLAARELFLTQSGVSQHIKNLETELGCDLFVRKLKSLYVTEEADLLFKSYQQAFGLLEVTLNQLKKIKQQPFEGIIKIGLPTEFGNNIVIPFLASWAKKYSLVKFDFIYGYGNNLTQMLENNELDLAFIDSFQKNKKIGSKILFKETLNLVVSQAYLKEQKITFKPGKETLHDLLALDYMEYEHKESILRMWFQYHYRKKNVALTIRAWAMNVQGVGSLVRQGLGVAILPDHVIEKLLKQDVALHIFKGSKQMALKNEISLVWLKDKPRGKAVDNLLGYILDKNL